MQIMRRSPPRNATKKEKILLCNCPSKRGLLAAVSFWRSPVQPSAKSKASFKARACCVGTVLLGFEYLQERRSTAILSSWCYCWPPWSKKGFFLIPKQISLIATCPVTFCCAHLERVWLLFVSDHSPGSAIPAPLQSVLASNCGVLHIADLWNTI